MMSSVSRFLSGVRSFFILTKLVNGIIELDGEHGRPAIRLINRDEFIRGGTYELTTITIYPDDPENAIAQTCPHLI